MSHPLNLQIRRATNSDIETLIRWRREAASWIKSVHNSKQWATVPNYGKVKAWIDSGEIFMVVIAGSGIPVATIGISEVGERGLWSAEEVDEDSLYLSRLIVDRKYAGMRIGESVIGWCQSQALNLGCKWIRLDVWRTNERLQEYYQNIGFDHVRTVEDHIAGAVFQRASCYPLTSGLHLFCFMGEVPLKPKA